MLLLDWLRELSPGDVALLLAVGPSPRLHARLVLLRRYARRLELARRVARPECAPPADLTGRRGRRLAFGRWLAASGKIGEG